MAGEGIFRARKKTPPARAPLLERADGGGRSGVNLYSPLLLLIFLAGAPFITEAPRQGALGGLTPYIRNQQLAAAI